jgi:hypothetical protein
MIFLELFFQNHSNAPVFGGFVPQKTTREKRAPYDVVSGG